MKFLERLLGIAGVSILIATCLLALLMIFCIGATLVRTVLMVAH